MKSFGHPPSVRYNDFTLFDYDAFYAKCECLNSFSFKSLGEIFKSTAIKPIQDLYSYLDASALLEAIFNDFVVDLFATCLLNTPPAYCATRTACNIFDYSYQDRTLNKHLEEYYHQKSSYAFWNMFFKANVKQEETGYKISPVGGAAILVSMEFERKEKIILQEMPENPYIFQKNYAAFQKRICDKELTWKYYFPQYYPASVELTIYFIERLWHLNYIYDLLEILNMAKNIPPFIPAKTEFNFNYDCIQYSPELFKDMLMWTQNSSLLANQYIIKNILIQRFPACIHFPSQFQSINRELIPSLSNCLLSYVSSRYEEKDAPITSILEDCTPYASEILKHHYKVSPPRQPFRTENNYTLTYYLQDIYSSIYATDKTSRTKYSPAEI